jgi:hypothetical protein
MENLLRYIKSDPPDILDHRNTIDIYLDLLYSYNRVFDSIFKVFLCSNRFSIKDI